MSMERIGAKIEEELCFVRSGSKQDIYHYSDSHRMVFYQSDLTRAELDFEEIGTMSAWENPSLVSFLIKEVKNAKSSVK